MTSKTKAVVLIHYAGVGCEMDSIGDIARRHGARIIEDNAHGLFGKYRGRWLGTFGELGVQSFHETKNITCGEGGALLINDPAYVERAEVIREKGTNRSMFFRGQVDKYTWVDVGSSYVMSDVLAAFLFAQLEVSPSIQASVDTEAVTASIMENPGSVLERGEVEALQRDATSSVNSPEASMWTKSCGNWLKSGSEPLV
jgi:dTDP-4-amino-4,6-dideoxygalactose transaminase